MPSPISAMPTAASCAPVYPGDTLTAVSEVIGLKENSNRKTGIVYVRSTGFKQDGTQVLDYVRWVMVRKRDEAAAAPGDHVPRLPEARSSPHGLGDACPPIDRARLRFRARRQRRIASATTQVGETIDHVDGMTVEEAEHQLGDPALSEHGAGSFQPVRGGAGPLRPPADLWRPCHLARARAVVQRPRQRLPYRGDQWRPACRAAVRRHHGLRLVGDSRQGRACRAATMSARCGCARSRRRISPAPTFR